MKNGMENRFIAFFNDNIQDFPLDGDLGLLELVDDAELYSIVVYSGRINLIYESSWQADTRILFYK